MSHDAGSGMDQLSAHLDRGWDLAQRGDTRGAATSARRAIEIDPESPEAYNLLGFAASLEGDCDEALEAYQQAFLLDDTYVEAMLNAAELYLHPLAEYDEAVELCEQILEVTDYQDEIIDTLVLKCEALIGKGDRDAAIKALESLPEGPYESPAQSFMVGRMCFELGLLDRARTLLEAAITGEPDHGDALYYRGLLREEEGDRAGAMVDLLRSLSLERDAPRPHWAPTEAALGATVEQALQGLPAELTPHVQGAEVFVVDLPGPEVVVDGVDPRTIVLVEPPPPEPDRAEGDAAAAPRIFVYVINALRAAGSPSAVERTLREAIEHEVAAAFGVEPPGVPDAEAAPAS